MFICLEIRILQRSITSNERFRFIFIFSLVDLGEDNDRTLKPPGEIEAEKAASGGKETVENAEKVTTEMAEKAGESPRKVKSQRMADRTIKGLRASSREPIK